MELDEVMRVIEDIPQKPESIVENIGFGNDWVCRYRDMGNGVYYLPYVKNKINVVEVGINDIVISSPFSGCIFAKFFYQEKFYVCHIASGPDGDKVGVWEEFIKDPQVQIYTEMGTSVDTNDSTIYGSEKISLRGYIGVILEGRKRGQLFAFGFSHDGQQVVWEVQVRYINREKGGCCLVG